MQDSLSTMDELLRPSATDGRPRFVACHLGRMAYEEAWALQRRLQSRLVAAKRGEAPPAPNVLLSLEHPPVVTLGKSGDIRHLLDPAQLDKHGIQFHRTDRGGDITYHGPGQLVVYLVLDLDRFFTDIHRYLRELEESVIATCESYGLRAGRYAGRTGVWIGPDGVGAERKICAMGIRCSRWVTMHGLALNISTDLTHFDLIVPCGITDRSVTSLSRECGKPIDLVETDRILTGRLADRFGAELVRPAADLILPFLDRMANS